MAQRGRLGFQADYLRVIMVAVFKSLALDGGVFAAAREDERRVQAGDTFHHSGVLHAVKLGKAGWGNERVSRMAERVFAEDGRERPEVVGAGGDGRSGVDDRGQTRQRQGGPLESMRV